MKFKILAGIFVVALSLVMIQANAQMHQHNPNHGGVVVMFGSSDHVEALNLGSEIKVYLSDANRKVLKQSDFEFVKAFVVNDGKEELLSAKESKPDSSELIFTLPKGDLAKSGIKFTVKRAKGNTNIFSQALPLSKVPVVK